MSKTAHIASPSVTHIAIGPDQAGQRIDNFLKRRLKGVPSSHIYRILRSGEVRVNSGRVKPAYKLADGDTVRLPPVRVAAPGEARVPRTLTEQLERRVLHEDAHLIVLDKPSGVAVHAGSGIDFGVIEAMRQSRPHAPMLELVHRLDRETSGCLLLAKSRPALTGLHELLRTGRIEKRYLALLTGRWAGGPRAVDAPLLRIPQGQGRITRISPEGEGKTADTRFEPLRRFDDCTLVAAFIGTGRTHQIRAHAAELGHPVAGDDQYGDFALNRALRARGLRRLFLHAGRLRFTLPESGENYRVEARLDDELEQFLTGLHAL